MSRRRPWTVCECVCAGARTQTYIKIILERDGTPYQSFRAHSQQPVCFFFISVLHQREDNERENKGQN